jgi:EAL domain-containing protein (putative c-di-GMP-specific phosphodiesterase class I)
VVAMARALGITTVAEGVETSAQAARLLELDCDAGQGFLYSRPITAERLPGVVRMLKTRRLHLVTETAALAGSHSQGERLR